MNSVPAYPQRGSVEQIADWLRQVRPERVDMTPLPRETIHAIFPTLRHRGTVRMELHDDVARRVRELRSKGIPLEGATKIARAEHHFLTDDAELAYHARRYAERDPVLSEMGIDQVSELHFDVALLIGEYELAARLLKAANRPLRQKIKTKLPTWEPMRSPSVP